jgi:tRNA1(Val) A37 N6-methylase TrmN6
MFSAGIFDHAVANPPFRTPESGRLCKNIQEAHARHELLASLENILDSARFTLRPGGRISLVYPSDLMVKLLHFMRLKGLEPKRIRFVHPSPAANARMVLVEGCKDAGEELTVLPPEFLNQPYDF